MTVFLISSVMGDTDRLPVHYRINVGFAELSVNCQEKRRSGHLSPTPNII